MDIYLSSALYRFFLKEHPTETKDEIKKQFFEKGWTEEQVYEFINNYRNIIYTEENIVKYVDLVSFFQYDMEKDFANYILHTYIIKRQFLDRIYGYGCIINAVCNLCEEDEDKILDDDILIYLSSYVEIDKLDGSYNNKITDEGVKHMHLHALDARHSNITDYGIKHMTLHTLYASEHMTNKGIKHRQFHTLSTSRHMTDKGIKHMQLHTLEARYSNITDGGIKHMQLHTLSASDNMTDEGIKHMQLHTLDASRSNITDEGIKHMQLHTLKTSEYMTDEGIKHMHLHTLEASEYTQIRTITRSEYMQFYTLDRQPISDDIQYFHIGVLICSKVTYNIENGIRKRKKNNFL